LAQNYRDMLGDHGALSVAIAEVYTGCLLCGKRKEV
jgi:hypothetical protein